MSPATRGKNDSVRRIQLASPRRVRPHFRRENDPASFAAPNHTRF